MTLGEYYIIDGFPNDEKCLFHAIKNYLTQYRNLYKYFGEGFGVFYYGYKFEIVFSCNKKIVLELTILRDKFYSIDKNFERVESASIYEFMSFITNNLYNELIKQLIKCNRRKVK